MPETHTQELTVAQPLPPRITLTVAEPVSAGSLLRIRGGSLKVVMAVKVGSVCAGGSPLPFVHRYSPADQQRDWEFYTRTFSMAVVRAENPLPAGTPLELEIETAATSPFSGLVWTIIAGKVADPQGTEFQSVTDEVVFQFVADRAEQMEAYLRPPGTVCVQHFDALGNPTAAEGRTLTVVASDSRVDAVAVPGVGTTTVELPAPADGVLRASVTDDRGLSAVTNARPITSDGSFIYFGDMHWHSRVSCDGQRDLAEALQSARDELCLDFSAPADHMDAAGHYYTDYTTQYQAEICRGFDEPGRFCTIPAAELGGPGGHVNVYCHSFATFLAVTERFEAELKPHFHTPLFNFGLLVDLCPPGRAVIVPHHMNCNSGDVRGPDGRPLWNAIHFPLPPHRKAVRLVEIVQGSGSHESEGKDDLWRVRHAGLGGSARTALMRGYRVGFVGGTDNHCGWPARGGPGQRVGLTAVLAERLDTGPIFRALHERHCYATSGARMVADVTCNGRPVGSELRLSASEQPTFSIRIHGTAPLTHVQIIHMGCVLADLPVETGSADFEAGWTDERPGRPLDDAYYYVRARQEDGHCLWCSPFWIDLNT